MHDHTAIPAPASMAHSVAMEPLRLMTLHPRRWAAVAAYVLLIYATLPLTPMMTGAILTRIGKAGFEEVVWIGLGVLGAALLYWLTRVEPRHRLKAVVILAGVGATAWFTSNPSEQFHLGIYGLLGFLVYRACGHPRTLAPLLLALGLVILAGVVDEVIQALLPNRYWDLKDIGRNVVGGAVGLFLGPLMKQSSRS